MKERPMLQWYVVSDDEGQSTEAANILSGVLIRTICWDLDKPTCQVVMAMVFVPGICLDSDGFWQQG